MAFVVLFALIAAFCNAIFSLANRFLVIRGGLTAMSASFTMQALTGILAFIGILVLRVHWVPGALVDIAVVSLLALVAFTLIMYALQREDASVAAPVMGLKVLFLAFLESMALRHGVGIGVAFGAVTSLAGVTFLSQHDKWSLHPRDLVRPGIMLAALSALCLAISDLYVRRALQIWHGASLGMSLYIVSLTGVVALAALALFPALRPVWRRGDSGPGLRIIAWALPASALTNFGMQYFIFTAFAFGHGLTLVNILYNTRSLFVIALAALLVLGRGSTIEKAGWRAYAYRTTGALLTLASVALVLQVK